MPSHKVFRAVVRNLDFPLSIFPHENFKRQIDGYARSGEHERRAGFGAAEDQQLCRTHLHTRFVGLSAVVDQGEEGDAFGFQNPLSLATISSTV